MTDYVCSEDALMEPPDEWVLRENEDGLCGSCGRQLVTFSEALEMREEYIRNQIKYKERREIEKKALEDKISALASSPYRNEIVEKALKANCRRLNRAAREFARKHGVYTETIKELRDLIFLIKEMEAKAKYDTRRV